MAEIVSPEAGVLGGDGAERGSTQDGRDGHADQRLPVRDGTLARRTPQRRGEGYYRYQPRFLQEHERGPWHVESLEDVEKMLCGVTIPVDSSAKIQSRWGLKPCLWCLKWFKELAPDHPMADR